MRLSSHPGASQLLLRRRRHRRPPGAVRSTTATSTCTRVPAASRLAIWDLLKAEVDNVRRAQAAASVSILAGVWPAGFAAFASMACSACSLVFSLHWQVLRLPPDASDEHVHGVRRGAALHRRRLSRALRRCRTIDEAAALLRHITCASVQDFARELSLAIVADDEEPQHVSQREVDRQEQR